MRSYGRPKAHRPSASFMKFDYCRLFLKESKPTQKMPIWLLLHLILSLSLGQIIKFDSLFKNTNLRVDGLDDSLILWKPNDANVSNTKMHSVLIGSLIFYRNLLLIRATKLNLEKVRNLLEQISLQCLLIAILVCFQLWFLKLSI